MTDATPNTGGEPGNNPGTQPGADTQTANAGATFTQEQVNAFLAEERRKLQAQQKAAEQKARQEAADTAAAEQGKFRELADTREARIKDLEPQLTTTQERVAALEALIAKEIEEGIKDLPAELRAMKPDGDVLVQRDWLSKARKAAQTLIQQRTPGAPAGPRGTGAQPLPTGSIEELKAKMRAEIGPL